jgi:hypothetical protein
VKEKFINWNKLAHPSISTYVEEYGGNPQQEDPLHMYIIAEYEDVSGNIS